MQARTLNGTNSLQSAIMAGAQQPAPEVGMGATILYWTDRAACTVIEVSASGKRVVVQRDKATRTNGNAMTDSQDYRYEADPEGAKHVFTLRKNGQWVREGSPMTNGTRVALGYRREYFDYGF